MLAILVAGALITNTQLSQISQFWLNRLGFAPNDLWFFQLERIIISALDLQAQPQQLGVSGVIALPLLLVPVREQE